MARSRSPPPPPPRRRERSGDRSRRDDRDTHQNRRDQYRSRGDRDTYRSRRDRSRSRSRDCRRSKAVVDAPPPPRPPTFFPTGRAEPLAAVRDGAPPPTALKSRAYSPPPRDRPTDLTIVALSEKDSAPPPADKEKPNFSATGLLAAATNTVNDVVLKYSEPAEARLPPASPVYKLFVFKDAKIVDTVELSSRSCWLIGRDRAVADLPVDHPSCSKQHAVLQFRFVSKIDEFGERKSGVRLYVIDLESANGTNINGDEIEGSRFVECREGDLLRFGLSTREYVIILERL